MGEYIVNGEVVDVRIDQPTAADLKREAGGMTNDWVMASMPGNKIVKVEDGEVLPGNARNFSTVPPFTYGLGASL